MTVVPYTTQLGAGLGMISETQILLELWQEGMDVASLNRIALESGRFPNMSARRLRNVVAECFTPRFLREGAKPATLLKTLAPLLSSREFEQLLFVFTCSANPIFADFVREVYWNRYASGRDTLSNREAHDFVTRAVQEGKTSTRWSPEMIERVAGYLTRCCADFGLLEPGVKKSRRLLPYRIQPRVAAILAYELHYSGQTDDLVIADNCWGLFGMDRTDVLDELRRLALKNLLIVQTAGSLTRISWQYRNLEELAHALAQG